MCPPLGEAATAETHSAIVFFVGDRAYKLKKPVDLGFLDFTTREARQAACAREVELNRRLTPDVYLGVADVHGVDGELCDHLVVMRRMPADRRLSSLVLGGVPVEDHLWQLAHLLAAFHARAPRSDEADLQAGIEATRDRWQDNTDAMVDMEGLGDIAQSIEIIQGLADRYLDGRGPLFERRIAQGSAVDGHGDLLADDIFCLDDGPRVLDCIEFDDSLRLGDGLADAAFLAMDLERLGRPDLGTSFLDAYREHRGDIWPPSLLHHQIAYRAQVRAKVTAIRAEQRSNHAASTEAHALLELAHTHLEAARVRLVIVGGLPGTGKSTIARALGTALDATILCSDEVRKELAGLSVDQPAPAAFGDGLYTDAAKAATYEVLLERAAVALGMGESVVLDASWISDSWRRRARALAVAGHADLVELRCDAPSSITSPRIRARSAAGGDASDATPSIAAAMGDIATLWPESVTVDTSGSVAQSVAAALHLVRPPANPAPPR